jgi:hypothetical protein
MPTYEGSTNQIKEPPQARLTDDQQNETKEQGRITQPVAPIAGRLELQERETESGQKDRYAQLRQCFSGAKRWARIVTRDFRRRLYRATFFLEILAFLVLGFYAWEAYTQKVEMAKSVDQQVLSNGPLIYHNGIEATGRGLKNIPNKVKITFRNYGRSLALSIVTIGHIVVADGESPPVDSACDENGKLPKTAYVDAMDPDPAKALIKEWLPTESVSDIEPGQTLYVVGCVYYRGVDRVRRYFTDVCAFWTPTKPQEFQSCDIPDRNYAH